MIDFSQFDSLVSLTEYFVSNNVCKSFLAESRWSDGDIVCPYCGQHHCSVRKDGRYRCNRCSHNFSVTVGTIFQNTKLPLKKWFIAIYLYSSNKKGISSCQLARTIKVTQDTAWYMISKFRILSSQRENISLEGTVELDEAYIGGEEKWKHDDKKTENTQGRSLKTKTPIFGMAERGGSVIVKHVKDTRSNTLTPIIQKFIKEGSRVFTDEYRAYMSLGDLQYIHGVVFHKNKKYVEGEISTNCVEGFWSHFKRMIKGVYHYCSVVRLQSYVDEEVFRWNTRKQKDCERIGSIFARANMLVVTHEQIAEMGVIEDGEPTPPNDDFKIGERPRLEKAS